LRANCSLIHLDGEVSPPDEPHPIVTTPATKALAGRRIALPETRELDRLATIFEDEGAETVRCPLVAILDAPDPAPIDEFLHRLARGGLDDLIILTGEGLVRLLARAAQIGIEADVRAALANVRKVTRGPKPARALHELGLKPDLPARSPTTGGIIETLAVEPLRGRRVGVQLYGSEQNLPLVSFLSQAGAEVFSVAPYIYAPASDAAQVLALIAELDAGRIDAIAFTSASQVDRIFEIAETHGVAVALRRGLDRTFLAAIGPIAAEALRDRGCEPNVPTEKPFVMKRLVGAIVTALRPPTTAPAKGA
jgi:uroporphyrinogen-III synthase